jgi:polyhydroxyalkanoate synthase
MTDMRQMADFTDVAEMDRAVRAAEAQPAAGVSGDSIESAFADWAMRLANQPERRAALAGRAFEDAIALWSQAMGLAVEPLAPAADDHRFRYQGWQHGGFALAQQNFLRAERWWREATTELPGVSRQHERLIGFLTRQMLDAVSPSNFPALNPEVIEATRLAQGTNLQRGAWNFMTDLAASVANTTPPLAHTPGQDVAITPGKIVFRNDLIELIQYAPTTDNVRPEPILIVPAWIMKYYILDLSPENSLIRYLVAQGYTVFCISWLNPGAEQRDLGLDDYRTRGVMAALDVVGAICGKARIHALGYCLGGTLLAIATAAMARDADSRLASLTLLAAQTDFTEAGELRMFITEAQLARLDDMMEEQGYLDSTQMAGAFAMLRSNDLIWSRMTRRYYLGEEDHSSDMVSWDEDTTRLPYRMHSEYLRQLYLHNDLAEGRLCVGNEPVSIGEIHIPCFVISTETDWVAPWHSVHKFLLLNGGDVTFALASGGHNGGIVSVPGTPHRHYRILRRAPGAGYQAPEEWMEAATLTKGSWWPAYIAFLGEHSSTPGAPPSIGDPRVGYETLDDAPGHYVLQR